MKTNQSKAKALVLSMVGASLLLLSGTTSANAVQAKSAMRIELTIPKLEVDPYHKPYIAVWIETLDRQYVTTIKLLADDQEWYKDLRQWWRKVARQQVNIDGVTGATKRPGLLTLNWDGANEQSESIPPGEYWLNVEASREEGGRDYSRQKITLGKNNTFTIAGKTEFGDIKIQVYPNDSK